jgi:DnaJ-class molecular chaperone
MSADPYASLGLTKTASADEIKKAYRKIARTSHPDLNPDDAKAEQRFKAASAAYDLLKDPETRGRFDRGEIDASGAERQQHQQRQYYRDYADAADNPYRSDRGYDDTEAADIFAEFLRQRGQAGARQSAHGFDAPGADMRFSLEVSFMDAATGGKTRITMPDGASLAVNIPRGAADGQTIRLRGKGGPGFGKGPAGDALITLSVRPHPLFTRSGNDITVTVPITFDEAVLGAKIEVPTLTGTVRLTVPKGASGGQTLRMRGRGVKPVGGGAPGDQKVVLRIVTPPKIDDELATFMESWRTSNPYNPRKGMSA